MMVAIRAAADEIRRVSGIADALAREAISKSSLIVHYAREWQDGRPSHENCIKQLNREQGFTAQRASRFLIVFDQCFDIMRATEP
jgi:hypothetical protein